MSKYSIEHIGPILKKARKEQGLSQRDLGTKSGMPQSHISKIESGLVDLQTSSLIELARILELELMLVPRAFIHTVQSFQERRTKTQEPRPKYRLEEEDDEDLTSDYWYISKLDNFNNCK
jgi:transcriptional regulator with XRE-family HTH domain